MPSSIIVLNPGMFLIYIVDIFRAMSLTIAVSVVKSILFPFLSFFLVYRSYMYLPGSLAFQFYLFSMYIQYYLPRLPLALFTLGLP